MTVIYLYCILLCINRLCTRGCLPLQGQLDKFNAFIDNTVAGFRSYCGAFNCLNASSVPPSQRNALGNNCVSAAHGPGHTCLQLLQQLLLCSEGRLHRPLHVWQSAREAQAEEGGRGSWGMLQDTRLPPP
jgi:hypothetical protein